MPRRLAAFWRDAQLALGLSLEPIRLWWGVLYTLLSPWALHGNRNFRGVRQLCLFRWHDTSVSFRISILPAIIRAESKMPIAVLLQQVTEILEGTDIVAAVEFCIRQPMNDSRVDETRQKPSECSGSVQSNGIKHAYGPHGF